MSSTRDSLSGIREESGTLAQLRSQLRETQEMAQDFQNMAGMNREAISLLMNSSPHAKDKMVTNLRAENTLLFRLLSKTVANNTALEKKVE